MAPKLVMTATETISMDVQALAKLNVASSAKLLTACTNANMSVEMESLTLA
jgi:hypothetical protein